MDLPKAYCWGSNSRGFLWGYFGEGISVPNGPEGFKTLRSTPKDPPNPFQLVRKGLKTLNRFPKDPHNQLKSIRIHENLRIFDPK